MSNIYPIDEIHNCPVPSLNNYDAAATLVSLINSKVNDKISRLSTEVTESAASDRTALESAITEGDATVLAEARLYAKALQSNTIAAYTNEEAQAIELENGESIIYFNLTNLTLVKKSKNEQGDITEQIYGKLTAIENPNPEEA